MWMTLVSLDARQSCRMPFEDVSSRGRSRQESHPARPLKLKSYGLPRTQEVRLFAALLAVGPASRIPRCAGDVPASTSWAMSGGKKKPPVSHELAEGFAV